jgi:TonB family protein
MTPMTSPPIFIAFLGTIAASLASTAPSLAVQRITATECTVHAAPAAISAPVPADYPQIAAEQNVSGTALVQVDLSSSGILRNATISESSGNDKLDRAALLAARQQTYSPQIVGCRPVGGSYLITVGFER